MTLFSSVLAWVDDHWLSLIALGTLLVIVARIFVFIVRKYVKPLDGTFIDGVCDIIEGILLRYPAIIEGIDKIRKGKTEEGIKMIVDVKIIDDSSPTQPIEQPIEIVNNHQATTLEHSQQLLPPPPPPPEPTTQKKV